MDTDGGHGGDEDEDASDASSDDDDDDDARGVADAAGTMTRAWRRGDAVDGARRSRGRHV